jgi:hypothetical protein
MLKKTTGLLACLVLLAGTLTVNAGTALTHISTSTNGGGQTSGICANDDYVFTMEANRVAIYGIGDGGALTYLNEVKQVSKGYKYMAVTKIALSGNILFVAYNYPTTPPESGSQAAILRAYDIGTVLSETEPKKIGSTTGGCYVRFDVCGDIIIVLDQYGFRTSKFSYDGTPADTALMSWPTISYTFGYMNAANTNAFGLTASTAVNPNYISGGSIPSNIRLTYSADGGRLYAYALAGNKMYLFNMTVALTRMQNQTKGDYSSPKRASVTLANAVMAAASLETNGEYVYVAGRTENANNGLYTYNVNAAMADTTAATAPTQVGTYRYREYASSAQNRFNAVTRRGKYLFVSAQDLLNIQVLSIEDPTTPALVTGLKAGGGDNYNGIYGFTFKDNFLFVSALGNGIGCYRLNNYMEKPGFTAGNETVTGLVTVGNNHNSVSISGQLIFAVYKNEEFVKASVKDVNVLPHGETTLTSNAVTAGPAEYDEIKIFFWDGINTMRPIFPSLTAPVD